MEMSFTPNKVSDANANPTNSVDTNVRNAGNFPPTRLENITKEVLSAFVDGDHRAFDHIYLCCFEPINGFFRMLLHNETVAEELCQEMFVRLWENRHSIDPERNFRSYLYTVAKSSALKHLRHKRVVEKYENFRQSENSELSDAPDEELLAGELQLMIKLALDKMPRQRRQVFEMSRMERLSNGEIASRLGIRESTVRAHLHNVIKKLKGLVSIFFLFFLFT